MQALPAEIQIALVGLLVAIIGVPTSICWAIIRIPGMIRKAREVDIAARDEKNKIDLQNIQAENNNRNKNDAAIREIMQAALLDRDRLNARLDAKDEAEKDAIAKVAESKGALDVLSRQFAEIARTANAQAQLSGELKAKLDATLLDHSKLLDQLAAAQDTFNIEHSARLAAEQDRDALKTDVDKALKQIQELRNEVDDLKRRMKDTEQQHADEIADKDRQIAERDEKIKALEADKKSLLDRLGAVEPLIGAQS